MTPRIMQFSAEQTPALNNTLTPTHVYLKLHLAVKSWFFMKLLHSLFPFVVCAQCSLKLSSRLRSEDR